MEKPYLKLEEALERVLAGRFVVTLHNVKSVLFMISNVKLVKSGVVVTSQSELVIVFSFTGSFLLIKGFTI